MPTEADSTFNNTNRIFVITVCRNAINDLITTIRNVETFKKKGLRHIIIDGDSTDGTLDYLKKTSNDYFYWISEPDDGIYDAMNKGWNIVPLGSYILYLGAGDTITKLPEGNFNSDVIFGNVELNSKFVFKSFINYRTNISNTLHHQSLLIKKTHSFLESPFDKSFKIYGDYDLNLRMISANLKFSYSESFSSYAKPGGISSNINHIENMKVISKNRGGLWLILHAFWIAYYESKRIFKKHA